MGNLSNKQIAMINKKALLICKKENFRNERNNRIFLESKECLRYCNYVGTGFDEFLGGKITRRYERALGRLTDLLNKKGTT